MAESKAPPFGFYIDVTARSTGSPFISSFHRWWSVSYREEVKQATEFGRILDDHFEYLMKKHRELEYPLDRLQQHREFAKEYFRL